MSSATAPVPARASLSPAELAAWRAFLRAHAQITRLLEAELVAERDLPLASYDVLVQLAQAPGRRLRMSELAGAVLLSRSGLTRLVDRLAREGLVTRESCSSDARGLFTVLTDAGLDRLRDAAPVHLRGVREHALDKVAPAELAVFTRVLERLAEAPAPQVPCTGAAPEGECG